SVLDLRHSFVFSKCQWHCGWPIDSCPVTATGHTTDIEGGCGHYSKGCDVKKGFFEVIHNFKKEICKFGSF
ncbi:hypothetical protein, partial [Heyndrickxia coagulans]|uniref:hypothetical protein n=1 Tax=Heyndrickxia coagulans TaxID=1398 RepID=UPI00214D33FF